MLPVLLSLFLYFLACDIVFCWDDLTMDVLVNFLEKARVAADDSKWNDFVNAMGGVFAKRKDQPLKLA
jgi:hypothetical protein